MHSVSSDWLGNVAIPVVYHSLLGEPRGMAEGHARCGRNPAPLESPSSGGMVRPVTVAVAQLVEHWIVAPDVAGSSPVGHPTARRERRAKVRGFSRLCTPSSG